MLTNRSISRCVRKKNKKNIKSTKVKGQYSVKKMLKLKKMAGIALIAVAISACEEDTLNIGSTLIGKVDQLNFSSATFNVETRTIPSKPILTRSNTCYFGQMRDSETGSYIKSEFMTQYHILETFSLPAKDSIVSRDSTNQPTAVACYMYLYFSNLQRKADSLAAMKMAISELATPAEEGMHYYSDYDPRAIGLLRTDNGLEKSHMFSYENLLLTDSARYSTSNTAYRNYIAIDFSDPYIDKNGRKYDNYGTYIIRTYYEHPEYFRNNYQFVHKVCPGFFYEITDGAGFYAQVPEIAIMTTYNIMRNDSLKQATITLAGTKEVLQTTKVTNDSERLAEIAEKIDTCTYIKSPAGLFTEVKLPVNEIVKNHESDSLLAASISFRRLNSKEQEYDQLSKPSFLLMVQKDSLETFFEKKKLTDSKTSYYTSLSSDNTYQFSNISNLINTLAKMKGELRATDPTWDNPDSDHYKVVLVPIDLSYYTNSTTNTSTVTNIDHSMSVASTRLVGGKNNPYDPVTISVVYSNLLGK